MPGMQTYVFQPLKVKEVIQRIMKERIHGHVYDPVKGSQVLIKSATSSFTPRRPIITKKLGNLATSKIRTCVMQQAKQLAEDLREQIKALGFDRHKLIIQVLAPGRLSAAEKILSCD